MKKISYRDRLSASFRTNEFKCRCRRADCDARPMDAAFIAKLQALRDEWGRPLIITSGARCSHWNTKVGGAVGSKHLEGIAADILMPDVKDIPAFVAMAEKFGFGGIGIAMQFVHLDTRPGHARWTY